MSWMNFNDADEQTGGDVIPHKTLAKVHMKIRAGSHNDEAKGWTGGMATRNDGSGAVYLDCEFTVMGGKYNKRKVWSLVGLHSPKGPKWEQMGRSFIRAALESARGIRPQDTSEQAMKARQINGLADLDGLEFVAQIDVEKAEPGSEYGDKNKINTVIPVTHKDYTALMSGQEPSGGNSAANSAPPPSSSGATSGGTPAWAQ
ncbi:hypothetical protein PVV74_17240 [Roseovarius sp. SK2]|uniref:hypothetical protein n=1 Tax=Roseovarius TaxID=74030 RepID=UPI00237A113C|nr:hypothetical protein [Roseovarius sp. SK2]MDD9727208.1 hypothetical protein [Roseovarius sp. SK2]